MYRTHFCIHYCRLSVCVCERERKREEKRERCCTICRTHVCITPPSCSVRGYVKKKERKRGREREGERERYCIMYRTD